MKRLFQSGISEAEFRRKIFRIFLSGFTEAAEKKNHSGTGLGLAIAKEIAKRHQINIYCESTLGQGTVFLF